MSICRRSLGYLSIAAIASSALTVGVAAVLVRHRIASQRMTALKVQADVLATIGGAPGALGPGNHVYRIGTGRPIQLGPLRSAAVLAAIPASADAHGTVDVKGRSILYVARPTAAGRVVLIRAAGLAFAEWRPFLVSLVLAGFGGVLLAVLLAYLLARRLTRPLGELAGATARVAAGEAGVVVPVRGEDELAAVAGAFNEMSAQLARAREAQRAFLESVSHELKTPLTSIRGYAEAVEEGAVAPSAAGAVIVAEASRLERLVGDLLDLARLQRADFAVDRHELDLAELAQQAVARHLPRARELSVTLRTDGSERALALADPGRLLQATSNLIENALRLTPAGGEVVVHTEPGLIAVRDSGPGLAAEDIPRAFERFYLHDRYRSERPVGSGLGLAIVEQLVSAMGGTVQAAAAPGGGAVFTIRLAAPSDRDASGGAPPEPALGYPSPYRTG
jgi:two-component system, OmpR family, sensor kinase